MTAWTQAVVVGICRRGKMGEILRQKATQGFELVVYRACNTREELRMMSRVLTWTKR